MKNAFLLLLLCLVAGLANAQAPATPPSALPEFAFTKVDGLGFVTNRDLKPGKAVVVMLFDPGCDHCQHEATWIAQAAEKLKNAQFLFVTTETPALASEFKKKYLEGKGVDVHFATDPAYRFDYVFGRSQIPSILIFGPDGKLRKAYQDGHEVPIEKIIEAVQ